jgi:putative heme-binding domain-containing protein
LLQNADESIRTRSKKLLGVSVAADRQPIVDRYTKAFSLQGDSARGKQYFLKNCATCHRLDGVGYELGPNLASFRYRGKEAILQNILDPNREVNPLYVSYTIRTHDERTLTGMIASETATSVTLLRGESASDVVLRSEIAEMRSSSRSIMPEGLESQLDEQAMADLISFLMVDK